MYRYAPALAIAGLSFLIETAAATPLEATCPSVSYQGPIIVATCYNALLQPVRSVLDVRGCVSEPANLNGQLVCERAYGGGYGARRWHGDY
jgi:hypothetical protein